MTSITAPINSETHFIPNFLAFGRDFFSFLKSSWINIIGNILQMTAKGKKKTSVCVKSGDLCGHST